MTMIKKYWQWPAVIFIAFVLLSSLPFKFTGHPQPTHIFHVVGTWLGIGILRDHGAVLIGVLELIAGICILIPALRAYGALLATAVISGAVFFHLFSPLGIEVVFYTDAAGNWVDYRLAEMIDVPYGDFFVLEEQGISAAGVHPYYQGVDGVLFWLAVVTLGLSLLLLWAHRQKFLTIFKKK